MDRIPIAIVGCGGMGGRHLSGVKELYDTELCNIELVAACDLRRDNAEHLADDADKLLGKRPLVFTDMEAMRHALPALQALDITTDSGSHHQVATAALELGFHVLCEKPLATTIKGCNKTIAAWQRSGKVLSVAEQFRRDPICRLMRALLDAGAIGRPTLAFDLSLSGGNRIIIFPWRHIKNIGGILPDAGVHTVDLLQYWLGPVQEAYARARLLEPIRYRSPEVTQTSPFYQHWYQEMPEAMQATAEDTLLSVLTFESGVLGQWTACRAAHGEGFSRSVVYGARGSLRTAGARDGRPLALNLDDQGQLADQAVLDLVPDFHLDAITARLFGGERLAAYPFTFAEADRKLVAVEYHELATCIRDGATPEVDAYVGRRDLAVVHAALESATLNRTVTIAEIESEATGVYEAEINAYWGI